MAARSPNRTRVTGGRSASASRRAPASRAAPSRARGTSKAPATRKKAVRPRGWTPPGNTLAWCVCVGVVLAAWWLYPVVRMHYVEQRQLASLTAEYRAVKSRNAVLRNQVKRLQTPQGIEAAARETLGLVRKGENAYVVMQPGLPKGKAGADEAPAPVRSVVATDPLTQLLDVLFGVGRLGR
jgi:cell division protein FtsB